MIILSTYYLILILYIIIVILIPGIGLWGIPRKKKEIPLSNISILIPFRNEADGLKRLCLSLQKLDHPKDYFEVIFVDDNSSDDSIDLLNSMQLDFNYSIIQNDKHLGKKRSLLKAIAQAKHDYIFTTDADCEVPKNILSQIDSNADISVGAVIKTTTSWSVIRNIQEVESLMLAGITLGSARIELPMLATGANLAYKKSTITDTTPYEDNLSINSGDDMFLLKATQVYNLKTKTRMGDPVITKTEKNWKAYIDQATRWAGKNSNVNLFLATLSSWIVLLTNVILPLSLITHFKSGWIILLIKFVVDFLFLFLTAVNYHRYKAIIFAPVVFIVYPIHLIRVVINLVNNKEKQ